MIELRLLEGEPAEMAELQAVLEGAPRYAERLTGAPPGWADALSTYTALPEGKTYDDKFVFGLYAEGKMVGCADLIRDWPRRGSAHLGLLLIAEAFQGRGYGRAACREVESVARGWHAERLRIGVLRVNEEVLPFWNKLGFRATGEVKPYRYGPVVSETSILEKPLTTITTGC
jgi:GNAT superfamily N-acetyltransferase